MDLTRLCVRLSVPNTGCQGPYIVPDIVSYLMKNEYDVSVISVNGSSFILCVNGQKVEIRNNTGPEAQWYVVRSDAKVLCLSPFRTETVVVGIKVNDTTIPIHDNLYRAWSAGTKATWESVKTDFPAMTSWVSAPVTFVEPSVFHKAIDLVIEATSTS